MKITYHTTLLLEKQADFTSILQMLEEEQLAFNFASQLHFQADGKQKNSIVDLHAKFYKKFRKEKPTIRSQIAIRGEMACLSAYRSIKSNKQKITKPISKKRLAIRLDKRLYSYKAGVFRFGKIKGVKLHNYPRLTALISKYTFCDPLIFHRDNKLFIALTFNLPDLPEPVCQTACGIDLGIKVAAATSEGKLFRDKSYLKKKRQLRFLKRRLQSAHHLKQSQSAKRHLGQLSRCEVNRSKNQCHLLANKLITSTQATTLVLENLSGIKNRTKKNQFKNLNRISQVPFRRLRDILTYKAPMYGKTVKLVNPAYTSQIDHRTGLKDGKRQGSRYTGKDGVVFHADINAAQNIALRYLQNAKLPVSLLSNQQPNRQAPVNEPIVLNNACKGKNSSQAVSLWEMAVDVVIPKNSVRW